MEGSHVEGEWYLDKEDTLVERLQPMMELIGAAEIPILESNDAYTKNILKTEREAKEKSDHILLGEISEMLNFPLRSSYRKGGPTFFSDKKQLTYYVAARKSGRHHLNIGRSREIFSNLSCFLEDHGYDVEQGKKGSARVLGVSCEVLAEIINLIEAQFDAV